MTKNNYKIGVMKRYGHGALDNMSYEQVWSPRPATKAHLMTDTPTYAPTQAHIHHHTHICPNKDTRLKPH